MKRIYLDPGVMAQQMGSERSLEEAVPLPGAAEVLAHLADSYELVVLGDPPRRVLEALDVPVRGASDVPSGPAHGSWLITSDPMGCLDRPPGLQTILIGPKRRATNKPAPRCDVEARDLNAAVVEILTRQAMS